jgi:hypothetical protein
MAAGTAGRELNPPKWGAVFLRGDPGHHGAPDYGRTAKGNQMISVVEWDAPTRNAAWVAACFGSLGE